MERGFYSERPQGTSQSRANLRAEFGHRDLPRHLALFYESKSTQLEVVTAFLEHGLTTNHKCLYLLDVSSASQIRNSLQTANLDVEQHIEAGNLVLEDASDIYLDAGFSPDKMIQELEDACDESLNEGYEGLYVAGENSWCFHTEASFDHILDFEADFDATCPDLPVVALCQYDLSRFGEESAAKALWTHKNIIYQNTICENPFYIPPEEYRSAEDAHLNVKLMLEQAASLTAYRREVDQHEQRLEVVNRVLRHNIRNDLNVVQLQLRELLDSKRMTAEDENRVDVALEHVSTILNMADRARHVQKTFKSSRVEPVHLDEVIEAAVCDTSDTYPEAEIDVTGLQDVTVLADTNLELAISEALTNGIVHQQRDSPTVSLSISMPTQSVVRLDVQNPGEIPAAEQRSVQQGRETQLNHLSGLGLWLIQWIVERGHGTVSFPETDGDNTTTRIELTRIPK